VALALAVAPAQAQKPKPIGGGPLKTSTEDATPVAEGQIASATAECPGNTKAVAGGWATTPPLTINPMSGGHYLDVYESQMIGNDEWRVSAVQYLGNFDSLTVYVYCQKRKRSIPSSSDAVVIPTANHAATEVVTECESGKVLSGGFLTEPPSGTDATVVSASHRASKRSWAASATRVATTGQVRTLTAIAYCAKASKIKQRSRTVPVLAPLGSSHKATPKRCPKRSKPRAGGFAVPPLSSGLNNTAVVHEARLVGNRWIAASSATGNGTSSTVTSFQYCRT
jgi:hypothetical protein